MSSLAREQRHRADAAAADEVREPDARVLDLAPARLAAQLHDQLVDLREPGRAARVAARDQAAVGVEGNAPAERGLLLLDELLGLALRAEAEQLVVLELLVREGVVAEREVDVLGAEAGVAVGLAARCRGSSWRARPPGPTKVWPGV